MRQTNCNGIMTMSKAAGTMCRKVRSRCAAKPASSAAATANLGCSWGREKHIGATYSHDETDGHESKSCGPNQTDQALRDRDRC
jgi:hypothetical protein